MSSKHQGGPAPVPPGNRPHHPGPAGPDEPVADPGKGDAAFSHQDPQRRLGNYQTAGEHAIQQPGARNDGDTHSK